MLKIYEMRLNERNMQFNCNLNKVDFVKTINNILMKEISIDLWKKTIICDIRYNEIE